ncbi:MAG: DMT family transporter [Burkholderiaceae bacterium]
MAVTDTDAARATPAMIDDARPMPVSAAALAALLCCFWGLGQVAIKLANAGISPIFHAGLRSIGATLLLLAWIWLRGIPVFRRDGTLPAGIVVGILFGAEFICIYIGMNFTEVARATLLIYCAPFFVAGLAHWLVPNDRLTPARSIGLLAAFAGVIATFADRITAPDAVGLAGDLLCVLGAFFWGATTIVIKTTRLRGALPEKNLLYQLGVSAVMLMAASTLVGEPGLFAPTPTVWIALAYTTIIIAGSSYLAWFWLVSRYRATTLHAFTFITPIAGVVFAHLLLGEPITPALGIGLALIAAGIVLVNREG